MNLRRAFVAVRWLVAAGAGLYAARNFLAAGHEEGKAAAGALHGLYALGGLLVAVILAAPELAEWVISPVNRLIDAVLMPSESEPPPLDYTLAHSYQQQGRYEEACEEYLKIIHYHPEELRAYLEGMITAGEAGQPDLAAKFHRLGQKAFRAADARERLHAALETSRYAVTDIATTDTDEVADDLPDETSETTPPVDPPGAPPPP